MGYKEENITITFRKKFTDSDLPMILEITLSKWKNSIITTAAKEQMGQHVADDRTPEAIYNIHRHPCSHHCVGISCQVVQGNEATVYVDDKIDITPTQVLAMKEIGEWEFLSIETRNDRHREERLL